MKKINVELTDVQTLEIFQSALAYIQERFKISVATLDDQQATSLILHGIRFDPSNTPVFQVWNDPSSGEC